MAELATVARPYAEALFRVAKASNVEEWSKLVSKMSSVAASADMRELAGNPKLSDDDIVSAFVTALHMPVSDEARNLVITLVENERLPLLPEISRQFFDLKNADQGSAYVYIGSAFALSPEQLSELVGALEKKFNLKLHPIVTVDEALIGGVRIVVGDEVLDTSVRAKLQQMHLALTT